MSLAAGIDQEPGDLGPRAEKNTWNIEHLKPGSGENLIEFCNPHSYQLVEVSYVSDCRSS